MNCQIEYVSSDSDNGTPCGKPAVTKCADCGSSICSDCSFECCGDSFCELCYDYHVTHECVRKPVQNESRYEGRVASGGTSRISR
jgi:hypothetical protein